MGETIIKTTKDNGFWINDSFIQLLSYYITKAFEQYDISDLSAGVEEIRSECADNLRYSYRDNVHIMFEEYIKTDQEKAKMLEVFNNAKAILATIEGEISIDDLNAIENLKEVEDLKRTWTICVRPQSLISTIDIIEKMLKGEWKEPSNYGVWFKGFPHPAGTQPI